MKLKCINKIEPSASRCIAVDSSDRLFAAGGEFGFGALTHNSVIQNTILTSAIMRPDDWRVLCIDLKRVELSDYRKYSNVVLGVATELEDALTVLRFAQATMMKRYTEMEQVGVKNFRNMPNHGPSLMVMVDELGELVSASGGKGEEAKEQDALKGEAQMLIGSIARLGRAAGVHLILATQRPDASLIPGETKANLGGRINAGRTDSNASSMILGNGEGTRVKSYPKGRLYIRIFGNGDHGQGFYVPDGWLDNWLKSKGLNNDGTPINEVGKKPTRKANLVDMNTFNEVDLDTREGIDTQAALEEYINSENLDDEGDFGIEELDTPREPTEPGDMSAPIVFENREKKDRFSRPEESWDIELEELINENFQEDY